MNDCRPKASLKASLRRRGAQRRTAPLSGRVLAGLALLFVLTLLAGCGQKGDLYLPDEAPEDSAPR